MPYGLHRIPQRMTFLLDYVHPLLLAGVPSKLVSQHQHNMFPRILRFIVPFLFVCLTLPQSALADGSTDFSNIGGTLSGFNASLSLTGSTLDAITTFSGLPVLGNLGIVSFSTGALIRGSLQMGGTFASGGSFTIDGNGTDGVGDGVLFSGAFSGPATWTLTTLANGTHNYTLTAVVTGTMGSTPGQGVTVQLTINTGKGFFNGSTSIAGGDTTVVSFVPEPSTLAMLSTGFLAIGARLRRRLVG